MGNESETSLAGLEIFFFAKRTVTEVPLIHPFGVLPGDLDFHIYGKETPRITYL